VSTTQSRDRGRGQLLLLGGTGYLGSRLATALSATGWRVAVLKRSTSDLERLRGLGGLRFFDVDASDGVQVAFDALGHVDAVVHAAGAYGRRGEGNDDLLAANTALPLTVLEAAVAAGTPLFVSSGTSLSPGLNGYALSKQQFSDWGRLIASGAELTFLDVRIEHFYGPGDDAVKFATHLAQAFLSGRTDYPLTLGEQERDFIYVDDVVGAYAALLARTTEMAPGYRRIGLGSGRPVTIRHFVEVLARLSGSLTRPLFGALPYRPHEVMRSCADVSELERLGWRPSVSLEDGIRLLLDDERTRVAKETDDS
jgi:CDP-paratose synthetase